MWPARAVSGIKASRQSRRKWRRLTESILADVLQTIYNEKMNRDVALEVLYAQVPRLACKGLCHASCGPIGMSAAEEARIGPVDVKPGTLECEKLVLGRCSIYAQRPMICRLWGVTEEMPCPHGCIPERVLTHEGFELLRKADAL